MRPESGFSKPAIIRSVVVLPQPDAPEQREELARRDVEVDAVDGGHAVERLDQLMQPDGAARHRRDRPVSGVTAVGQPREVGDEPVDVGVGRAAPTAAIAPPCPMAAGTRRRCAASASAGGRSRSSICRKSRNSRTGSARNVTQPLAPTVTTCQSKPWRGDDGLQRGAQPGAPARRGGRTPAG